VDSNATTGRKLQSLQDAARSRGVELSIHQITRAQEIPAAIDAAKAAGAEGLNALASPIIIGNHQIIIQQVAALRLPAIYQKRRMRPRREASSLTARVLSKSFGT
jgi:hypothetical protein